MKKLLSLIVLVLVTFMLFVGVGFASVPASMDMHKASTGVTEVVKTAISDMIMVEAARLMDFKSVKPGSLELTYNMTASIQNGEYATEFSENNGGMGHKIDYAKYTEPHWPVIARITGKGVACVSGFTEPSAREISSLIG